MIKFGPALWIIIGLVLAALEMVVPGFILIWFGVAALVTGLLAFVIKNAYWQIGIFVGLSAILILLARPISRRLSNRASEPVGATRLIGLETRVLRAISPPEYGRVKALGEEWRAQCATAVETGGTVKILRVEGTHLVVEPVEDVKPASGAERSS